VASYALANAALLSGHRPVIARGDEPDEIGLDDLLIRDEDNPATELPPVPGQGTEERL
jgi:hypothetical protein